MLNVFTPTAVILELVLQFVTVILNPTQGEINQAALVRLDNPRKLQT